MARAVLDQPQRQGQAEAAEAAGDEVGHVWARAELDRHLSPHFRV